MSLRTPTDERAPVPDTDYYLPAGTAVETMSDYVQWAWSKVFNHGIETSR